MSKRLESSMERRLRTLRRELVRELFLRRGPFWDLVRRTRELAGIEGRRATPPRLDPGKVHLPDGLEPVAWTRTYSQTVRLQEWMVLLHSLHNAAIPPDLRVETPRSPSLVFWMGFLSACVVYDPPPEGLLGFADHGVAAYGDFVNPLNPEAERDGDPVMLAPPIRFLVNPDAAYDVFSWWWGKLMNEFNAAHDRVIDALHSQLSKHGIDVREMAYRFEFSAGFDNVGDPVARFALGPYIEVDEHTTEGDVRNAFRLMAADLAKRPRATKPRRDPLVSLQCAVWYDECGWSHERIAQEMNWAVQHPAGAKPRSETVRQHVAEGRLLRFQEKDAA